jgi:hypothetical protein
MAVYEFDPLTDSRWTRFLDQHHGATAFHSPGWLAAIQKTYGYEPIGFTTSGADLTNAMVFCRISSWMTGRRLVSLPFSDHCRPLAEGDDLAAILKYVSGKRQSRREKYVELRPLESDVEFGSDADFSMSETFHFHTIDLRPDLKSIYSRFHDSCIRRKIKRAEREKLVYESGRSKEMLEKFRHLLFLTRRRHKLPPQPAAWFENVIDSFGDAATIHLASKDSIPVASILTLAYKKSLVYKYGCSDGQYSNLGGTPLLFWKAIEQAKENGLELFDLGRSTSEDPGLIAFKDHLGADSTKLTYYRNPMPPSGKSSSSPFSFASAWGREALGRLPDPLLAGVGQLLYRHIG